MFSESDPMSGQRAVTKRSAQFTAMVLRTSAAVYLLFAPPGIGAFAGDRGEDRPTLPTVQSPLCRSHIRQEGLRHRIVTGHKACTSTHALLVLGQEAFDLPDPGGRPRFPIDMDRRSWPLAEALLNDRPPQVRAEVRRWRTAILASTGKVPLSGRHHERRFTCGASRRDNPSLSLHDLFCTWII